MPKKTLLLALAIAAVTPPVRATGKALLLLSEVVPSPVKPLHLLPSPRFSTVKLSDGTADLYLGLRTRMPGVVVIHGVAPGGPRDPRVKQISTALNRLGRTVLVPSLALGEERLDLKDTARIRQAIDYLSDLTRDKVMVLAFSFGAGYTLVALEEKPEIQSKLHAVTTVGTYFDLVHLLQGVTAGRVTTSEGTGEWSPDPQAGKLVVEFLAEYLELSEAEALIKAYEERDPVALGPEALSIYELMTNRRPERTRELVNRLPAGLGRTLESLSPAGRIDRIRVPVLAMHSRQDPASPPSESALLVRSVRPPSEAHLTLVGSFRHVTPARGTGLLKDALPLIGFARRVLATQERWSPFPGPRVR